MKKIAFYLMALVALTMMTGVRLQAQAKDMFPMDKGLQISYICYDADGKQTGSFTRVNKEAVGEMTNGHIIAAYNFYHADGSPFWKSDNVVKIEMGRRSGASYTIIDLMSKFMKIRHLLPTGDPSTVTTAYAIGDKRPDAEVAVKLGHMDIKILILPCLVAGINSNIAAAIASVTPSKIPTTDKIMLTVTTGIAYPALPM